MLAVKGMKSLQLWINHVAWYFCRCVPCCCTRYMLSLSELQVMVGRVRD